MVRFPLIVSYYTKDTPYQLEVQELIASCEKWGLEHHIEPISSLGSWERNCCFKPFYLLEKMQHFQRPLFWVDADGVFLRRPQWLSIFDKDLAVRINETWEETSDSKVITSSLFVNATTGAARILTSWCQECIDSFLKPQRTVEIWDQIALRDVLQRGVEGTSVGSLPLTYAAIVDHPSDAGVIGEAVIAQHQASRRFKKIINNTAVLPLNWFENP
jgi:hypothetical protein